MPELKPLDWPPLAVEIQASDRQIDAMVDRVKRNFEFMGQREPYWSVLSAERYLAANIAGTEGEFFASGKEPVEQLRATAARCGVALAADMSCLELGCGVGRSTIWLADIFRRVTGSDVSRPHLNLAAANARRFRKSNVDFVRIDDPRAIASLPAFDVFFSIIVLQHNPPPVILRYLKEILDRLKPGGLVYFQVPTYRFGYRFGIKDYLAAETALGTPEMHVVLQPDLYALFDKSGCRPLEVREDSAAGENHVSHRFFLQKRETCRPQRQ